MSHPLYLGRLCRFVAATALTCALPLASATVLNFDDLGGGSAYFTSDYQGFMIGNNDVATTDWFHTTTTDNPGLAAHSGTGYIAVDPALFDPGNNFQAAQSISSTTAFVFNGAWFSGDAPVQYELFNGASLVFTSQQSPVLSDDVSTFVASGYTGLVTSVVIVGHQGYYGLDDFTVNAAATTVPEPELIALLAIGLVAAVGVARRGKARAG